MNGIAASALLDRSASFLEEVYVPERALYPLLDRGGPRVRRTTTARARSATRSTLSSGCRRRRGRAVGPDEAGSTRARGRSSSKSALGDITSPADLGLLLVLLRDRPDHPAAAAAVVRIAQRGRNGPGTKLPIQTLSWMQWGLDASARRQGASRRRGSPTGSSRGSLDEYVHEGTLLPRHSSTLYRRNVVSFGAIVYFLRAVHEHAPPHRRRTATRALFRSGVERMLAAQGPQGEWPWLYAVATGRPAELYPVYAVHQDTHGDALPPPRPRPGDPGVRERDRAQPRLGFGANELRRADVRRRAVPAPSARSSGSTRFPRVGRYVRAVRGITTGRPPGPARGRRRPHQPGVPLVPPGLDPLRVVVAAGAARRAAGPARRRRAAPRARARALYAVSGAGSTPPERAPRRAPSRMKKMKLTWMNANASKVSIPTA